MGPPLYSLPFEVRTRPIDLIFSNDGNEKAFVLPRQGNDFLDELKLQVARITPLHCLLDDVHLVCGEDKIPLRSGIDVAQLESGSIISFAHGEEKDSTSEVNRPESDSDH